MEITPSQETLEQGASFVVGVLTGAKPGRHVLTLAVARGVEKIVFSKDHNNEVVIDDDEYRSLNNVILVALEQDHVFGATLRSFSGAGDEDAPTEVRGWVVTSFSIRALNSDEIIDAYCTDAKTGKMISPEADVAYMDGWEIGSAVSSS